MKEFDYYLQKGDTRKVSKDIELAKSLKKDLLERAEKAIKLNTKEYSKMIFENIYDSLREFCDFLLAVDGYKSYSHEASISYLKKYGFNDTEIMTIDMFRYKRNGSKYYGKEITKEDAEDIKSFYLGMLSKIKKMMDKQLKEEDKNGKKL